MGEFASRSTDLLMATPENMAQILENNAKVKIAGIDCDGALRGKIMAKEKSLSSIAEGFWNEFGHLWVGHA